MSDNSTVETTEETTEAVTAEEVKAEDKTLSQAEVDRIVKDRLAREKAKYSDYADLKKAAEKLASIEEANKTDLQRATDEAENAKKELAAMRSDVHKQKVINAATKNGAIVPEQVASLLDIPEDGDIDAVVETFLLENPHFVKKANSVPSVAGNDIRSKPDTIDWDSIARMKPEDLAKNPELLAKVIAARDAE
jgi:hypothetical protein